MNVVGFVGVMTMVTALIHFYLWRRLVREVVPGRNRRRVAAWVVTGLAGLVPATLVAAALPLRYERWLAWPGYLWLGIMFYLLVTLLALEVPVLAARLILRRRVAPAAVVGQPAHDPALASIGEPPLQRPESPPAAPATAATHGAPAAGRWPELDRGRRLLLRRGAAVTAGLVAAGATGWGLFRAYRPPTVRRVQVPLRRLDPRADGLRVVVVADLHVGPLYGAGQVRKVVDVVNGLDADLVAVVGDMVSSEPGDVRDSAAPLRDLRTRYGAFFVTGNHEYYTGHEEWIEAADELGLRVLRNERVEIVHRGGTIDLAGVNDLEGGRHDDPPDYATALGDRDPSRPAVLLAHQPVQVHEAAAYGVDLQLSGHTHGGQLFPFHLLVRLEQPVLSGLAEVDGTLVYVTNGAGFWGPPMRVGADPEVGLLELRAV